MADGGGAEPAVPKGDDGSRPLAVRVKTAKGRRASSTRWLQRQLNDPYVARAKREGYRSRSAYKLIEADDRYGILAAGQTSSSILAPRRAVGRRSRRRGRAPCPNARR